MGRYGAERGRPEVKNAQPRSVIFAWQARGPGFESPMLHLRLNSELALHLAECQGFGVWTTIFGLWTTIGDHLLETLATAGDTTACPRGTL